MQEFQGKTAVITGAASGLGLEVARAAAGLGMKLVLVDIQAEKLEAAAAGLRAGGAEVMTCLVDVAKAPELQRLADETVQRFGVPHFMFNNAGIGFGGLLWEHTEKDWDWVIGVNLMSIAHAIRIFVPLMLAEARRDPAFEAHIVNTASMAGLVVTPNVGAYTVTKHAAVAISEQLYQDLSLVSQQVRCSVLCPYFVPTEIHLSENYRPPEFTDEGEPSTSKKLAQAAGEKAVKSGQVSAETIAQFVFDAVKDNRFYIYSHPRAMRPVRKRMEEILAGKNPSDPFASKPSMAIELRRAIEAG